MIRHLVNAIIFVSIVGAFCSLLWFAAAYVRHVHRVLLMMADSGYGYKDSAYLVRRVTRRWLGKPPGTHRAAGREKQQPLALVEAKPVEGDPLSVPEGTWPLNGGPATSLPEVPQTTVTMPTAPIGRS
jgi:hypothetical protein